MRIGGSGGVTASNFNLKFGNNKLTIREAINEKYVENAILYEIVYYDDRNHLWNNLDNILDGGSISGYFPQCYIFLKVTRCKKFNRARI